MARVSGTHEFGAFSAFFTLYLLAIIAVKGTVGGVAALRLPALGEDQHGQQVSNAVSASVLVALVGSIGIATTSVVASPTLRTYLLILAVALPVLMLQDALRYLCYATSRPWGSVSSSGAWLVTQVLAFGLLFAIGDANGRTLTIAWAVTAFVGAAFSLAVLRPAIRVSGWRTWFGEHREIWQSLSWESMLIGGVTQGVPLLVAVVAGVRELGALRGAMTLVGPFTTMAHGIAIAVVPEATRLHAAGAKRYLQPVQRAYRSIAVGAVIWGVVLAVLPDALGRQLLGDTWSSAHQVALLTAIYVAVGYLTEPAVLGLRVSKNNWAAARIRTVTAAITISAACGGAYVDGARGAALALIGAGAVACGLFWSRYSRVTKTVSL